MAIIQVWNKSMVLEGPDCEIEDPWKIKITAGSKEYSIKIDGDALQISTDLQMELLAKAGNMVVLGQRD